MSFLGNIFGTNKAIEEGTKTIRESVNWIGKGIDAAFYTEEEKAADHKELFKERVEMAKALQDQFAPRAITRRVLALIVFGNFYLHINVAIVLWFIDKKIDFIVDILGMETKLVLTVAFFYFGYYGIKQALKKG